MVQFLKMPPQQQRMEVEHEANQDHHRSTSQVSIGGKSIIDDHAD